MEARFVNIPESPKFMGNMSTKSITYVAENAFDQYTKIFYE